MDDFESVPKIDETEDASFTARNRVYFLEAEGANAGRTHSLEEERVTVGRSAAARLCIEDNLLSRFHAVLTITPIGYEIRDLRSANGTFVNGLRVESRILAPGDLVRIGNSTLRYGVEPRPKKTILSID